MDRMNDNRHLDPVPSIDQIAEHEYVAERAAARRAALRDRHLQGVAKLMDQRSDLRGVHGFADFVDDAVRWSA